MIALFGDDSLCESLAFYLSSAEALYSDGSIKKETWPTLLASFVAASKDAESLKCALALKTKYYSTSVSMTLQSHVPVEKRLEDAGACLMVVGSPYTGTVSKSLRDAAQDLSLSSVATFAAETKSTEAAGAYRQDVMLLTTMMAMMKRSYPQIRARPSVRGV